MLQAGIGFLHHRVRHIMLGTSRAHLTVVLTVAHHVAQREKNRGENQHQQEQANDVPALQHPFARASSFSSCHRLPFIPTTYRLLSAYLPLTAPLPRARVHWLIISMGKGNTIVVFFSVPISVRVCR